jgi:hypothetical protein
VDAASIRITTNLKLVRIRFQLEEVIKGRISQGLT